MLKISSGLLAEIYVQKYEATNTMNINIPHYNSIDFTAGTLRKL
jgi:broad specificity polyphosphatase/5'/3'-nucleotidase SurE